jgi:hypothetical protein
MKPLEIALVCWLIACAIAGLLQIAAPRRIAAGSVWGIAVGWQREIALWNFALCVGIFYALVSHDEVCKIFAGRIIAVLSILLGINHLAAVFTRPAVTHAMGIVANGLGFALIIWGLLS